jgi:glucose-1-phosphate thymidylyltransferase
MKCLIMAGGFDTRIYPFTQSKAKTLITYRGKPLLTHLVEKIPPRIDVMVSINKRFEADFRQWLLRTRTNAELLVEEEAFAGQKTGAVSALNLWIRQMAITEDLLVIGGDNYFEFELRHFITAYDHKHTLVAVCDIGDKDKASHFGVVELADTKITSFREKPESPSTSFIATACYIFPPRVFPLLERYCAERRPDNLGDFITYLVAKDEVRGFVFKEPWFDIGSKWLFLLGGR